MAKITDLPMEVLLRMQRESLAASYALSDQEDTEPRVGGLGFTVGDLRLVLELTSITDIVECGAITRVPRTRAWVRGIANVRGGIYSIVDLGIFLSATNVPAESEGKLVVLNEPELGVALLVNRVYGLRYFDEENDERSVQQLNPQIQPYTKRAFQRDDELWGMLDTGRFTGDHRFRQVSNEPVGAST